jgi:hypothetical protein
MARLISVTEDNAVQLFRERMKKRKELYEEIKYRLSNGILIDQELDDLLKSNESITSWLLKYIIDHELIFN